MPDALLLDDIGMALLDQLAEAHDDWRAIDDEYLARRSGPPRTDRQGISASYSLGMSRITRGGLFDDLSIDFAGHIWLLMHYPETPPTRRLPWHMRLDEETMQRFDDLRAEADNTGPESRSLAMLKEIAEVVVERYKREKG